MVVDKTCLSLVSSVSNKYKYLKCFQISATPRPWASYSASWWPCRPAPWSAVKTWSRSRSCRYSLSSSSSSCSSPNFRMLCPCCTRSVLAHRPPDPGILFHTSREVLHIVQEYRARPGKLKAPVSTMVCASRKGAEGGRVCRQPGGCYFGQADRCIIFTLTEAGPRFASGNTFFMGGPPDLAEFTSPNSFLMFSILGQGPEDLAWLRQPVEEWPEDDHYVKFEEYVNTKEVTNDSAERAIGNLKIQSKHFRKEDTLQAGIVVDQEVKKKYPKGKVGGRDEVSQEEG